MLFVDHESNSCRSDIVLELWLRVVKVTFSFKPLGIEKIEPFSRGTENNQNLRYESLIVVTNMYIFPVLLYCVLNIK